MAATPELLATLRHALLAALAALLPAQDAAARERLAGELVGRARCIAGHTLPTARNIDLADLADASPHYRALAATWSDALAHHSGQPDAWIDPAVARLLDVARKSMGGAYIPGDRADLDARDDAMWDGFRGDITATALAYGISYQRARQILVARMRAERAARQGTLF